MEKNHSCCFTHKIENVKMSFENEKTQMIGLPQIERFSFASP